MRYKEELLLLGTLRHDQVFGKLIALVLAVTLMLAALGFVVFQILS